MAKYKTGDRFQVKDNLTLYIDWKTFTIVGEPYELPLPNTYSSGALSSRVFYPVHINGLRYGVIPEGNIEYNFDPYVEFTPGFYQFISTVPSKNHMITYFKTKPQPQGRLGHWERCTVVDQNGVEHR